MSKPVDPEIDLPPLKKDNRVKAIVFMNVFSISQCGVSIIFKFCSKKGVSVAEWMLWRNTFNFLTILVILKSLDISVTKGVSREHMPWLWGRGVLGQICFAIFSYSLTILPLTLHMIIFQTSPFWVSILAYLLIKEKV